MRARSWSSPVLITAFLAAIGTPGAAQPPPATVQVETFQGTGTLLFTLPGTPQGPRVDFSASVVLTSLSFTPGAVTFSGQPVDFSGTEAAFLSSSYSATSMIPVPSLPGPVTADGDVALVNPEVIAPQSHLNFHDLTLGPSFAPSTFDVQVGSGFHQSVSGTMDFPAASVFNVFYTLHGPCNVQAVDPVTGVLDFSWVGSIDFGPPDLQVNTAEAWFQVNGRSSAPFVPGIAQTGVGQPGRLDVTSTLVGSPWDLYFGFAPLNPTFLGAPVLPDFQVINVQLQQPGLQTFNQGTWPPFNADLHLPLVVPVPLQAAGQGVWLTPTSPTGVVLSSGAELQVF